MGIGWKNVKLFEKLFLHECTNCFLRQQKKSVSFQFNEKHLFSKVFVIFQNLSDSKHKISSFSPLIFLAGLLKLNSGVERNISWRKPTWHNLFSETLFFRILNKKNSDFSQNFFGRFRKNRSTCPDEQSMKKHETKKRANKQNYFQELVLTTFGLWWNFSGRFVNTVFYLRVTFWWKAAFASERLTINFFWHLAQTLKVLAKLLPAQLYKLLSTCLKGKHLLVPIFERKLWFWKFLQIFMIWRIHSKTSSVSFNELLGVLSKLHSRCPDEQFVKKPNLGKKLWKW